MKEKKTTELLNVLNSINNKDSLNDYLHKNLTTYANINLPSYFERLFKEKGIKKSDVISSSNLSRTYAYQILNGTKKPSRDKIIQLCIGARLNLEETERALTLGNSGKLYAKNSRDSIIIFAINKGIDVVTTNELLYHYSEAILGDED